MPWPGILVLPDFFSKLIASCIGIQVDSTPYFQTPVNQVIDLPASSHTFFVTCQTVRSVQSRYIRILPGELSSRRTDLRSSCLLGSSPNSSFLLEESLHGALLPSKESSQSLSLLGAIRYRAFLFPEPLAPRLPLTTNLLTVLFSHNCAARTLRLRGPSVTFVLSFYASEELLSSFFT
jgi:hypothetical protein